MWVVIFGQEPYKNIGKANGRSFFIKKRYLVPPSLTNILKEIFNEIKALLYSPMVISLNGTNKVYYR